MNATLRRLLEEGSAIARSDGTVHAIFPTSISHEVGKALRSWVERERAAKTLEIGLGYGISALFICDGLQAAGPSPTGRTRQPRLRVLRRLLTKTQTPDVSAQH